MNCVFNTFKYQLCTSLFYGDGSTSRGRRDIRGLEKEETKEKRRRRGKGRTGKEIAEKILFGYLFTRSRSAFISKELL